MLGTDIEISDDVYIVQKSVAEEYRKTQTVPTAVTGAGVGGEEVVSRGKDSEPLEMFPPDKSKEKTVSFLRWAGEVTPQKWMNFYTKVLSRFVSGTGLKLKVEIEVKPDEGISQQKVEQTKVALRELGLDENVEVKKQGE